MYLLFMTCTPVFAGPKEDALGAYHWFFELFTTDNHDPDSYAVRAQCLVLPTLRLGKFPA